MTSVKVNDLIERNRLLSNELDFANDLIDCLQRLRKCLIDFNANCNCVKNCDNKTYFKLLDHKYKQLIANRRMDGLSANRNRPSYLNQLSETSDIDRIAVKKEVVERDVKLGQKIRNKSPNNRNDRKEDINDKVRPIQDMNRRAKGIDIIGSDQNLNRFTKRSFETNEKTISNKEPILLRKKLRQSNRSNSVEKVIKFLF